MRRAGTRSFVIALALASGCVRACDCGATEANEPLPDGDAGVTQSTPRLESTAGAPAGADGAPGRTLDRVAFTPAPDSKLTRALLAAREEIERDKVYDKLDEPAVIAQVLGDQLGALRAVGTVSAGARAGSSTEIVMAARNYSAGEQRVRVKIIDTAISPEARRAVSEHLAMIGNEAAGNQRGVLVRGQPAVVAHFAEQRASQASALIGNRYLVQVMVNEPPKPDAALDVIEQLDFGKLAPKSAKARTKGKEPPLQGTSSPR
jgi:hypothetical protein